MPLREPRPGPTLAKRILQGNMKAAAEVLTMIENKDQRARPVLKAIYSKTGKAHTVGVTGAGGTGKSTLIDQMTSEFRRRKKKVGILTVDPSSPFSGGAFLGDRIRMRSHFLDDGVFIRSLATRGGTGGVPATIRDAIHLLDALGKDVILIETIGVGQDQIEISSSAQTVMVVLTPSMGDEIQSMKAGLIEIADIVAVNKADLPGAKQMVQSLEELWPNPRLLILKTSAITSEGIDGLVDGIEKHRKDLLESGSFQARSADFSRVELLTLLQERILERARKKLGDDFMETLIGRVARREMDPYTAAARIAKGLWH